VRCSRKSRTASAELNLVLNALQMWKDEADCGGLVMWREMIAMIGFQHLEVLKLMEQDIEPGVGRLMSV